MILKSDKTIEILAADKTTGVLERVHKDRQNSCRYLNELSLGERLHMIQSSVQLETIGEQLLRLYRGFSSNFEMGIIPQIIATKGTPFLNRTVRPQNTENSGGGGGGISR